MFLTVNGSLHVYISSESANIDKCNFVVNFLVSHIYQEILLSQSKNMRQIHCKLQILVKFIDRSSKYKSNIKVALPGYSGMGLCIFECLLALLSDISFH